MRMELLIGVINTSLPILGRSAPLYNLSLTAQTAFFSLTFGPEKKGSGQMVSMDW